MGGNQNVPLPYGYNPSVNQLLSSNSFKYLFWNLKVYSKYIGNYLYMEIKFNINSPCLVLIVSA